MTLQQRCTFADVVIQEQPTVLVHGDCVGADAVAHQLALAAGLDVHVRPCDLEGLRAFCSGATMMYPVKGALERDRDIVECCDLLVATPHTVHEVQRSGTWYTVRYARHMGRPIVVIGPAGDVVEDSRPASL